MSIVALSPPAMRHADDLDPFLAMPLAGIHLIEASAGTGKTYTLATLVARLVIERGLRIGQILTVTFSESATQELRERLRRRIQLVARVAAGLPRLEGEDPETALCRALIERQLEHEDAAALRARLQQAARELDLAAVHTIHGFCTRVLADHAMESGEPFGTAGVLGSDRELREQVAADLWRELAMDPVQAMPLMALWDGPDALAKDLVELLRAPVLRPHPEEPTDDGIGALRDAAATLRAAFIAHGAEARRAIDEALAAKRLNGNSYRQATLDALWDGLHRWCMQGDPLELPHPKFELATAGKLAICVTKGKEKVMPPPPRSPLFDAAETLLRCHAACADVQQCRRLRLVHTVRERAQRRLAQLKRQRRVRCYDDLIDGVARALEGPHARALLLRLRAQYRVALVDEFQDTDPRQWSIFRRIFGAGDSIDEPDYGLDDGVRSSAATRFLALVGDPKQAIYRFRGGDVHTYLHARDEARPAPRLDRNFRSRPCVLHAVERLYGRAGDAAFVDERIRFQPVDPGGRRDDFACLRRGDPAPALTVRRLPDGPERDKSGAVKDYDVETSRELAARTCVEAIHEILALAQAGEYTIDGRAVQPGDLAVIVRRHDDGLRVQRALAAAGIPAVSAGRISLFATEQALELLAVFEALLAPSDPLRLHAAFATTLLGWDAPRIDELVRSDAARARALGQAVAWRERWLRHGPLSLVNELCAQNATRLLELVDGERRLSDLLQLAEALQEAARHVVGPQGLVDWLRARIAGADDSDREQQLRLESDARRVQILTVHKSKGLEFPFVFLPFAGIAAGHSTPRWCSVPDGARHVLDLAPDEACKQDWKREERAEEARLLYVGLTRAEHALWVAAGPLYGHADTPLAGLLGDLATLAGGGIVVDDRLPGSVDSPPLRLPAPAQPPRARQPRRQFARDWSIYSFSALARQAGSSVETLLPRGEREDAETGAAPPDTGDDPRFVGSRFGDVVHGAFERVAFDAWRDWQDGGPPPPAQADALVEAFRAQAYPQADIDAGLPLLASLVGRSLNAVLPEGVRLTDVPPTARRAEMEFHFTLDRVPVEALLTTVQAHGLLAGRQGFGNRRTLEGLMTGKIDLVYTHEGRYYLLDYKTNRLPDYTPATLERAMHEGEYTLQAAIYSLALHRWLRLRLGEGYDYERHFGGARYIFCRGVDMRRTPASGVHCMRLPRALVDALDVLFGGGA